jgi:hypothetical protein
MNFALLYNLNFTQVYINLEKYVIHQMNFMLNLFIVTYSVEGGREVHETYEVEPMQ